LPFCSLRLIFLGDHFFRQINLYPKKTVRSLKSADVAAKYRHALSEPTSFVKIPWLSWVLFSLQPAADLLIQAVEQGQAGKGQQELTTINQAIRLQPNYAGAYFVRAIFRSRSDNQGAIKDHNEAIRLNPQFADAYNNRGNIRLKLGDKQGAITNYAEAIRLNPQYALAFYNRGLTYTELGD
jgi:tetratricopeptide (TPR) repeat protein